MKDQIIQKYKNKTLGMGATKHVKDHNVADFMDEESLISFIVVLAEHEADLTKSGYEFLEEYYGLDTLVKLIKKHYPNFEEQFVTGPITDWLKTKGEFALN